MGITRSSTRNEGKESRPRCRHSVESDSNTSKLVFDCRGCPCTGDLSDTRCFGEVIAALRSEFNIDSIIFSDYVETYYFDSAMEALRRISGILNDVQRFTGRTPWSEVRVAGEIKSQARKKICSQCPINPITIFSAIDRNGKKSVGLLCRWVNHFSPMLQATTVDARCAACVENTRSDLRYIREGLEELRRYVLYQGFRVVEGES